MILSAMRFHAPQTVEEAVQLLSDLERARVLAGGTDLLVDLKQGLTDVEDVISLQGIEELKGLKKVKNRIRIGATTTAQEIASSSIIREYFPALSEAAQSMASIQVRTLATIGGNISSAVPSADLPPPLIAADATVELLCTDSSREVPLADFFTGPRETVCRTEELLVSVCVPLHPSGTGISYKKCTLREANSLAVASVASRLTLKNGKIEKAAVVLGAVAPTPVLASKASRHLQGKVPSSEVFKEAAALAKEEGKPISDVRGSAWYRKELIHVLTHRSLSGAFERVQNKSRKKK